ncbi:MAG TPA: hypothetical protein VGF69_04500 [Thermoanaerobaculia bacterium]|jgi:4-amino-4-deoxy-L-arabinose transferase-like glycosyltransferase
MTSAWAVGGTSPFLAPDSWTYLKVAGHLAADFVFQRDSGVPELSRTPGYPLLLVPGTLLDAPVLYALALNLLFVAGIVLLTYDLARRLTSQRTAAVCAFVVALEPTLMTWSMKVMPEALFTLCLLVFARAAIAVMEDRPVLTKVSLLAAAALCTATYVKPIVYPFVAVSIVAAFFIVRPRTATLFAACCVTLLAPWHLRNYAVAGYAGFSTIMERAAYLAAGASVAAERARIPTADMRQRMLGRANAVAPAQIRREGLALIRSDPFGYAVTHAKGMLRTLFDPGALEYPRMFGTYREGAAATVRAGGLPALVRAYPLEVAASVVLAVALLPLVILPAVAAIRFRRDPRVILLALLAAYLIVAGGGVPGYHRFRVPAVPFLVLLSATVVYTSRNGIFGGRRHPDARLGGNRDDVRSLARHSPA